MPLYTAEALVLRTYKLGEADRIVVFLTRDRGKKRGVAPNARKSRKRFGAALAFIDIVGFASLLGLATSVPSISGPFPGRFAHSGHYSLNARSCRVLRIDGYG